ncbi:hypothetical protein FOZ63_020875, partial [Perkinsus olseni]
MTRTAHAGEVLYINAKSYAVLSEDFSVLDEANNRPIEVSNLTASDDSLWCTLTEPLEAGHLYTISVKVHTPVDPRRIHPELFALTAKQLVTLPPESEAFATVGKALMSAALSGLAKMTIDS